MENVRNRRINLGMTMKELGEAVGVSESTIGMIETGKRKPSFELLLKLGEALNCSVDDLVNNKKIPTTDSDGSKKDYIDELNASQDQKDLIREILKLSPDQVSAFLSLVKTI